MPQIFSNNSKGTVAAAGITAAATTIPLTAGHGARFPAIVSPDYAMATLSDGVNIEVVKITGHVAASDNFTVVRAQEDVANVATPNAAFASGAKFEMRLTNLSLSASTELSMLPIGGATADPVVPAARALIWVKEKAKFALIRVNSANMADAYSCQPALWSNAMFLYTPGNGATVGQVAGYGGGGAVITVTTTISHPAITSTSVLTRARRSLLTTLATAGSTGSLQVTDTAAFFANRLTGFFFSCTFAIPTAQAGARLAIGLTSIAQTTPLFTAADPTAAGLGNFMGLVCLAADTVLKFGISNATTLSFDATTGAAASKTNATDLWEFSMYHAPNGTTVNWRLENLSTGVVVESAFATNIPATTVVLRPTFNVGNGSTAAALVAACARMYVYSDY